MATTAPFTGITVQDQNDPAQGGLQIGNLAKSIETFTIPRFSSTSARDSATSAFTSAGGTMAEGQYCEVTANKQMYRWTSGSWQWPPWAQGQLARSWFIDTTSSSTNYLTPLAKTGTNLPAFNVTIPTIPAGRHIKVTFFPNLISDTAGTVYGFVITIAGKTFRGMYHAPVASTFTNPLPMSYPLVWEFDTTTQTTPATGGVLGAQFTNQGSANCYMVSPGAGSDNGYGDGPAYFLVEDLGSS